MNSLNKGKNGKFSLCAKTAKFSTVFSEVAIEEVNYFFARADEDKNGVLFHTEISQNYKLFMDSEIINPE